MVTEVFMASQSNDKITNALIEALGLLTDEQVSKLSPDTKEIWEVEVNAERKAKREKQRQLEKGRKAQWLLDIMVNSGFENVDDFLQFTTKSMATK